MKFRYMSVIALILAGVVTFCSCTAKQNTEPTASAATVTAGNENLVKQEGGELFIAMPSEVASFDPLLANTADMIDLLSLVYETPLAYESNGLLKGCLVESWEVNDSKDTFTFKLRQDVTFSDGETKLTADDIVYSANRVRGLSGTETPTGEEEETAGDSNETPSPEEGDTQQETEDGEGEVFVSRYTQYSDDVEDIRKVDDYTVELKMREPGNAGLHFMTFPVMNETLQQKELPVGTGVYMVERYSAESELILIRNPYWWNGQAYIERVVAKPVSDVSQKLEFVESSIIDLAATNALYASKYKQPGKTQVIDYMTNYYDCLVPNLLESTLQDVKVRQAIAYAIDRREILSTVLLNHGVPTNLPLAPDFYAFEPKYKISDYDNKVATQMLQEAGYKGIKDGEGMSLSLELIVQDDRNAAYKKEAAKAIKKQLAQVGVEIEIVELAKQDYEERLQGGNFDLAYCSFYTDMSADFGFLFDPDSPSNYGHVKSAEIDAAIDACALAVTEEESMVAYEGLQQVLTERVPQIGLYYRMNSIICDESITGIAGLRQNMIYSNIADWYNVLLAQSAETAGAIQESQGTEQPEASQEATEQPTQTAQESPTISDESAGE